MYSRQSKQVPQHHITTVWGSQPQNKTMLDCHVRFFRQPLASAAILRALRSGYVQFMLCSEMALRYQFNTSPLLGNRWFIFLLPRRHLIVTTWSEGVPYCLCTRFC
ncbi:hypothetical protein, unlikely [Trypanosoma brucei gambiense DAL972]|uniref:Uncharacterized protein n=1 Tax=Trypanosoma brucei gambiense (strain MHOM/CI/86/DAL972) TaxID=679716 RepID=D0A3L3_TRYB9|nr:hypothetical protein, unlikely [Trypanosoma brucei gambiense DAL972]CBH15857.1 hypothetical protein, unlikely [Trypanosoma brucei gambiense DAL972]|eukprot:XP_011778121.1 hypothetical protein, unlikely [Trypanosoma brucei gambiense DAL972]